MQSGIAIADNVRDEFQNLRMRRAHRYIIFRASADKSTIEIEKLGARTESFEDFKNSMPKNNSR